VIPDIADGLINACAQAEEPRQRARLWKQLQQLGMSEEDLDYVHELTAGKREEWRIKHKIIDRLVEAVETGEYCGLFIGPYRFRAISWRGIGLLRQYGGWPEAMRRIAELGKPAHPQAQAWFLPIWHAAGFLIRGYVHDDDLFFAGLRVVPVRNQTRTYK
jgi:hypothetical protein